MQQRYCATKALNRQGLSTNKSCNSICIICTWQPHYSAPHQADYSKTTCCSVDFIPQHGQTEELPGSSRGGDIRAAAPPLHSCTLGQVAQLNFLLLLLPGLQLASHTIPGLNCTSPNTTSTKATRDICLKRAISFLGDLPCTCLAHFELESMNIITIIYVNYFCTLMICNSEAILQCCSPTFDNATVCAFPLSG